MNANRPSGEPHSAKWPGPALAMDSVSFIADTVALQAKAQPNAPAQIFEDRVTSYAVLDRRANQVANGLLAFGLKPGSRIGYLGKNSDYYFELLLGALRARLVLVPVSWRLAPPEAAAILQDAGAHILFVGRGFATATDALAQAGYAPHERVAMDGGGDGGSFATWRDIQADQAPGLSPAPEDTAIQLYTSGTTGLPKGVELTNRNLASFVSLYASGPFGGMTPADTVLTAMPVFHLTGTFPAFLAFAHGCCSVVLEEAQLPAILQAIERHRASFTCLVPSVINALVQHPAAAHHDLGSIRRVTYGASPISDETIRRAQALLPQAELWQVYGLTETCACATALPPEFLTGRNAKTRSCGRPFQGVEIRVIDAAQNALPAGAVGEIVIRCAAVMKAYWNNQAATQAAFLDGGWLRTGDAGYFDEDGFLFIHDRIKDMIVSGGENIYPAEVENVLFAHPGVADAAVIGVPDDRWGEAVKAFVVARPDHDLTAEELLSHSRRSLAGYKLPKSIEFVTDLPRSPAGKVLRRSLREPFWAGRDRQVN